MCGSCVVYIHCYNGLVTNINSSDTFMNCTVNTMSWDIPKMEGFACAHLAHPSNYMKVSQISFICTDLPTALNANFALKQEDRKPKRNEPIWKYTRHTHTK